MRIKSVAIENFRLIADSKIDVPTGLTLVNGENGLGKSSIFQAILWCLFGPDSLGGNQTSLVRQGHRNLSVSVAIERLGEMVTVTRKFTLNPDGKSGRTELSHDPADYRMSQETIAEKQAYTDDLIGARDLFMSTAYVDQHDGPGAFLRSKPAEQREQLRRMLNISDTWDTWAELAKLKHKTVYERIMGNEARMEAAQEFIDQNGEAFIDRTAAATAVAVYAENIQSTKYDLETAQDAQDKVDLQILENTNRQTAIDLSKVALKSAMGRYDNAILEKSEHQQLAIALPELESLNGIYLAESERWSKQSGQYQQQMREYVDLKKIWDERLSLLKEFSVYCERINLALDEYVPEALEIRQQISNFTAEVDECPTCKQELKTDEAQQHISDQRTALADDFYEVEAKIKAMPERIDWTFITDEQVAHYEDEPFQPELPSSKPVFNRAAEHESAKTAGNNITNLNKTIQIHLDETGRLEDQQELLPLPLPYDNVAYAARSQEMIGLNNQIEQAESDKRDRERNLAAADNTLEMIEKRKTEIVELQKGIKADEKLRDDLDIVVTGVGPNGARQLMIDQQLADFQGEVNKALAILLPGFSIYMDTQAESGRETFETMFATPTGVIGWTGLSGAQRVGVGLSTRIALASMVQARQGFTFETWIIDEADGAMRGEKREAFVAMLYKLQQQGIDLLVVSHADTVVERMEQRIEVTDAGGYTEVK